MGSSGRSPSSRSSISSGSGTRATSPIRTGSAGYSRGCVREQGIDRVDLLKMDVEGAEHLVLAGLAQTLGARRVRFVQFEYGRVNILTKFLLHDFYELFRRYGYVVGKIFPDFVDFRAY